MKKYLVVMSNLNGNNASVALMSHEEIIAKANKICADAGKNLTDLQCEGEDMFETAYFEMNEIIKFTTFNTKSGKEIGFFISCAKENNCFKQACLVVGQLAIMI